MGISVYIVEEYQSYEFNNCEGTNTSATHWITCIYFFLNDIFLRGIWQRSEIKNESEKYDLQTKILWNKFIIWCRFF